MSDAEDSLWSILSAIAQTYALELPETDSSRIYPAIVYRRISTVPRRTQTKNDIDVDRFQIDVYGTLYDAVKTTAKAIVSTLEASSSFKLALKSNRFDIKEQSTGLYRTMLEFIVWE